MNASTKAEANALTLPQRAAVALGAADHEIKLRELVKSSVDIVAVIDPAGREQAHRIGMTLKNARVTIEKTGKAAREDAVAFGKAVIAEEKRLVEIITDEESRVFGLRDGYDAKVEAARQAEIAAEMARTAAIAKLIDNLRMLPAYHSQSNAAALADAITEYDGWAPNAADYAEFVDRAAEVIAASLAALRDMLTARQQQEQAAADAEAARLAEIARMEAERVENARIAAENARQAAEVAAERQRLADEAAAQQKAAAARQKAIDDEAAAARAAQSKAAAEQQAAFDAQAAEMAAASRKLAEQQAAADARDAAELAKQQDAARREDDHGPALLMNAEFDDAREAERQRLQSMADQAAVKPRGPLSLEELAADLGDIEPTDLELLDVLVETFGMSHLQVVKRLAGLDFDALCAGFA